MKTIFRSLNFGLILAAIFALGAVAGMAQDPCADGPALEAASTKVRDDFTNYAKMPSPDKHKAIDNAKAFVEKYGACEPAKDLVAYVNQYLPGMEKALQAIDQGVIVKAKEGRFNDAVKAKNTDEILAAGKDLLAFNPETYRAVELALASLGYDESIKTLKPGKYTDESLRYGRQAISDLEGGKSFATFNLGGTYVFTGKDDALAWMNASVGYLTFLRDRKAGLPFIYKATQTAASSTAKEPFLYEAIGDYYRDEASKIQLEIADIRKGVPADASQDVIKQTNDTMDAKNALSFGYAERALDAYARAFKASTTPAAQALLKKKFSGVYQFRFDKTDGVDAWIASAVTKPFPNPTTEVVPVKIETTTPGTTGSGVGAANGTGVGAANGTGVGAANGTGVGGANGTGPAGAKSTTTTTTPVKSTTTTPAPKPIVKKPGTVSKKTTAIRKHT